MDPSRRAVLDQVVGRHPVDIEVVVLAPDRVASAGALVDHHEGGADAGGAGDTDALVAGAHRRPFVEERRVDGDRWKARVEGPGVRPRLTAGVGGGLRVVRQAARVRRAGRARAAVAAADVRGHPGAMSAAAARRGDQQDHGDERTRNHRRQHRAPRGGRQRRESRIFPLQSHVGNCWLLWKLLVGADQATPSSSIRCPYWSTT
jgi:hypothetical protein